MKQALVSTAIFILFFLAAGCAPAATPFPTPRPFALPATIAPTPLPLPSVAPTVIALAPLTPTAAPPTSTLTPSATATVTAGSSPTRTAATLKLTDTPTRPPTAPATATAITTIAPTSPTATATIALPPTPSSPPGIYVTSIRTDPDPPSRGNPIMFYATFLNTTGGPQDLRWIVFIYKADSPSRIMGETTLSPATIPANTSEQLSQGYWKLPATGPCDFFLARVAQFDANNQQSLFTTPDGKVFEKGFSLCQ